MLTKTLNKTVTNGFGFFAKQRDRVLQMLQDSQLSKPQNWKQGQQILHEAMLVKSYQQLWFRNAIVKYLQQKGKKQCHLLEDKLLFEQLFGMLKHLDQQDLQNSLDTIRRFVHTSSEIQKKKQAIGDYDKKDQKFYIRQRRLMYDELIEKVKLYYQKIKDYKLKKSDKAINLRQFLQETYSQLLKNHKQAVIKYFKPIKTITKSMNKQCPKLLRYQFQRLLKQINPITVQRDQNPKAPNWVYTKTNPDDFNYKTHNKWANAYKKNKNKLVGDKQTEQRSQSLWGQKKVKQRQVLLMTYSDAKQCYFHPKVKKMD